MPADAALGPAQVAVVARDGSRIGGGFLFTGSDLLTCAHVVNRALGLPELGQEQPVERVTVEFALLDGNARVEAEVFRWDPIRGDERGDAAWLRLLEPAPPGAAPVALLAVEELWDHEVHVFGFPAAALAGAWAQGRLRGREAAGRLQIDDERWAGYQIQPGFSGSPLWDERLDGVVGMVVAAAAKRRTSYMIPAATLIGTWPELGDLVGRHSPYPGLRPFRLDDREFFFGRDELVRELADSVERHRVTVLYGPSGCGKTSLVSAGVMPLLRLAATEVRAGEPVDLGADLVFVDQAEEFAGQYDRLEQILALDTKVIVAMRADFLEAAMARPGLAPLWGHARLITPMSRDELRRVIVRPAARRGVRFEDALVEQMLDDVGDTSNPLPLLQFALSRLWRSRSAGGLVTLGDYAEMGGVSRALALYADEVWRSEVTEPVAQRLFTRLVEVDERPNPVRRRAGGQELDEEAWDLARRLATARLVTLDGDSVELAHETLIQNWPELRDLVAAHRPFLTFRGQLARDLAQWERSRAPEDLLHGAALVAARSFGESHGHLLTSGERAFVARSAGAARRRGVWRAGVIGLAVAALVASFLVVQQRGITKQEQARVASSTLSAQAASVRESNPVYSALLAVEAWRTAQTPQAELNLFAQYVTTDGFSHLLSRGDLPLTDFAISGDGSRVLTLFDFREAGVWRIDGGRATYQRLSFDEIAESVHLSLDGGTAAIKTVGSEVRAFRLDRTAPEPIQLKVSATDVGISGEVLLAAEGLGKGGVRVYDLRTGTSTVPRGLNARYRSFAGRGFPEVRLAADGHTAILLWYANGRRSMEVWDLRSQSTRPAARPASWSTLVVLSADGSRAASCGPDADGFIQIRVYDVVARRDRVWAEPTAACGEQVVAHANGAWLAHRTGRVVDVLDMRAPDRRFSIRLPLSPVVAFEDRGEPLFAHTGEPGAERFAIPAKAGLYLFDVPHPGDAADDAMLTSDGSRAIMMRHTPGGRSSYSVWEPSTGSRRATLVEKTPDHALVTPDGRHVVFITGDRATVRSLPDLALVRERSVPALRADSQVGFGFDGRGNLATCADGAITRWSVPDLVQVGRPISLGTSLSYSDCILSTPADGPFMAAHLDSGPRSELIIWNADTAEIRKLPVDFGSPKLAIDQEGRHVAMVSGTSVMLVDGHTGEIRWKQNFPGDFSAADIRFDPSGRAVRVAGAEKIVTLRMENGYVRPTIYDLAGLLPAQRGSSPLPEYNVGLTGVYGMTAKLDALLYDPGRGPRMLSLDPEVWVRHLCGLAARKDFTALERRALLDGAYAGSPC